MTEPSIDGLIADFERHASEAEAGGYIYAEFEVDIAAMRALIASWRERGEALKELVGLAIMPDALTVYNLWPEALERARAVLDKP